MQLQSIIHNIGDNYGLFAGKFPQPELIEACVDEVKDTLQIKPPITVFGKKCNQQRDIAFLCNTHGVEGYNYSNQIMHSQTMGPHATQLLQLVNTLTGAQYNAILINRYVDGTNCIGKHSDDETYLDPTAGVFLISWGVTRKFRIRAKGDKGFTDIPSGHMDVIHMTGNFQKYFTHEIPVEKKVKGERYSFTFRYHVPTV